ncbi:hypothetical protein MtrunA17_Chr4g0023851 [Medicago truncatula]|uniref:Uncharacterized protein n=1 Tax=Medicago truncatula TaxID=3880 RepID=A0A396IBR7_MEDTR|nr:hypothetical protein MtrunA17_Chr4g0023851 [Medicago truncatula]
MHAEGEKLKGAATLIPTKEEKEESTILGFRVIMKIASPTCNRRTCTSS